MKKNTIEYTPSLSPNSWTVKRCGYLTHLAIEFVMFWSMFVGDNITKIIKLNFTQSPI